MMIVLEEFDEGESSTIYNSNDGSTSDTGIATGSYNGKTAKVVATQKATDKFGPIFKPYDPAWSSLLAMNF